MTRNVLKKLGLIRIAFIAAVGLPLIITTSAHAQAPAASPAAGAAPAGAQAEAERVIVTGSNIPTAEEVGPNPVLSLNRDFINKSSEQTAEKLLQDMPVANANSIPISNNATSQGGPAGAASVALRGFDPSATLVLVDGHRIASFPGSNFFDLNTIPLTAVESIEILKDGASATYGADAVAGVVNFKMFKDYRGAQVDLYYGDTLDKDAGIYRGDLLFGTGDDKMSVVGDIFFFHHNSMFNKDRGNSANPPFLSSNASPYNLQLSTAVVQAAGGTVVTGNPTEFGAAPVHTDGFAPATAYHYSTGRSQHYNFNSVSGSYPEQERWGGYAAFNDKICDDQVQLYGDFFYDDVREHDELAPGATGSFFTPGQTTIAIPPHMNLNGVAPAHTPVFAGETCPPGSGCNPTNVPTNAFNPFNPFNQIISGGTRARLVDFGNRFVDNENTSELFTLGVKGDKLFDGNWGYDAGFRYSQISSISQIQDVNVNRFNQIMNAADPLFQPGSANYIGQTTPFDPFDSYKGTPVKTNAPLVSYARLNIRNLTTSKLTELYSNIYTTDLFDLPAGGVGLAFGANWRRENFEFNPDDQARLGEEAGVALAPRSRGGRKDYAFYAETQIPIFSPEQGIWGFHSLTFGASGRFEEFRNNDTNVLVPKVELRWQPFNDEFTIRSTWGEGFLEPALFQLFSSSLFGLSPTVNPKTGASSPETTTETTGNRNLQPEDSRSWTGGFVYSPKWVEKVVPGLTMTAAVDLYDIERTGITVLPNAQNVVARCTGYDPNTGNCTGGLSPGQTVASDPGANFQILFVKFGYENLGRAESKGADFTLTWNYQTPNWGTFSWLTQASYLESLKYSNGFTRYSEISGRANNDPFIGFGPATGGDGFLKWKAISRVDWSWRNFDLNWTVHYLDGFKEEIIPAAFTPSGQQHEHFVHGTWFFDCQAGYDLIFTPPVESQPVAGYSKGGKEVMTSKEGKQIESAAAYTMPCWKTILNNTTLTVGCDNVFGQDPPKEFGFESGDSTNYPGFLYDNLGRFVYVELKKKF